VAGQPKISIMQPYAADKHSFKNIVCFSLGKNDQAFTNFQNIGDFLSSVGFLLMLVSVTS
jgi:hypothetical protein